MRIAVLTLVASLSLVASVSARADDLGAADAAFDHHDYSKAFELYQPLARAGDPSAQSAIGSLYYFGNGVPKDAERAYLWFSVAAQSDAPVAIVAQTNRDLVRSELKQSSITVGDAMADVCIKSRYAACGLAL